MPCHGVALDSVGRHQQANSAVLGPLGFSWPGRARARDSVRLRSGAVRMTLYGSSAYCLERYGAALDSVGRRQQASSAVAGSCYLSSALGRSGSRVVSPSRSCAWSTNPRWSVLSLGTAFGFGWTSSGWCGVARLRNPRRAFPRDGLRSVNGSLPGLG